MLKSLLAAAITLAFWVADPLGSLAQTPNGYINPPVYGTGLIPESKSGTVTTTISASFNHPTNLVVYNIAAITAWTILLPNPPFDGQFITVSCTTSVATLTILSTDGSALASGIPNSCAATANVTLQWSQIYNTWYVAGGGSGGGATSTTSIGSALFFARNYGNCTWSSSGDVGPCINLAIAAAAAQGGGTVMIPAGVYGVATPILQQHSGIRVQGAGVGSPRDNFAPSSFQAPTRLTWTGTAGATMFDLEPNGNTQSLYSTDVWGITFDCASLAGYGFRGAGFNSSHILVGGGDCQITDITFTTDNITDAPGTQDNDIWAYSRDTNASFSPIGILFDSFGPTGTWNFSFNRIHKAFAWFKNGDGIVWGDTDNNLIDDMSAHRDPGGTGNPVVLSNHFYTSPNGFIAGGHPYANNFRHTSTPIIVAGYQSGSTFASTAGTNSCSGGGNSACGPGTVFLTTNAPTNQQNKVLNFAATTGIVPGEAVTCNNTSASGVLPGEILTAVGATTATMTNPASGTVATSTPCAFAYGITSSAAAGVYTLTSTAGNTFTLTAPGGGHTQTGIAVTSSTLTFTDVILPWTGTATTGDSWTLTVPGAIGLAAEDIFAATDNANSVTNPRFEFGTSGAYARTNAPYWIPISPLGIGQAPVAIGNGSATGQGAIVLGGGSAFAAGFQAFATGNGNFATGFGASVFGHNNNVTGAFAQAINDTNNAGGGDSFITGYNGNDFFRFSSAIHSYGNPNGNGSAQHADIGLWGSASGSIAVAATGDGTTASSTNIFNILDSSAYGFTASLIAFDTNNPAKTYTAMWGGSVAPHILSRGAGVATTLIDGVSTAISPDTTRSNGSLSGVAATLTADTTHGGITAKFTPPTSNTDSWTFVFSFSDTETK